MNVKKDRQISKLTREKRKNEQLAQRNAAELKVMKRKKKQDEIAKKKADIVRRRRLRTKTKINRKIRGKKQKRGEEISKVIKPNVTVEIDKVREWIEANVEKMATLKHLQKDMVDLEAKKNKIEEEIEDEQKYYSEISIK